MVRIANWKLQWGNHFGNGEYTEEEEKGKVGGRNWCNVDIFKDCGGVHWTFEIGALGNKKIIIKITFRGLLLAGEDGDGIKKKKKDFKFIFGRT